MSESFVITPDNCDFVYSNGGGDIPTRKQALNLFDLDQYSHPAGNVIHATEKWLLSSSVWRLDTKRLEIFLRTVQISEAIRAQVSPEAYVSVLSVEHTEAAAAFITSHGLKGAAEAVEVVLHESFEDVKEARLDYDPGDEEEDDHPWIRIYVNTGMEPVSLLAARREFYKKFRETIPWEQAALFHLSVQIAE